MALVEAVLDVSAAQERPPRWVVVPSHSPELRVINEQRVECMANMRALHDDCNGPRGWAATGTS